MKRLYSLIISLMVVGAAFAQNLTSVSGTIVDEQGLPLVGASVTVPGTTYGVTTDINGMFVLKVDAKAKDLVVSYVGYKDKTVAVKGKLGNIKLESDATALEDIIITQSVAVARKTPVAVSTLTQETISERIGTMELPEVLNTTPGVYAHKQGGGFGDSEIRMRGFQQANIAVMINGVPINDMEWGGTYWSNWMGLADVTRSMQTQRGLGASKISSPSVGGMINIVTAGLEAKKGGKVFYGTGNDGMNNVGFSYSTGMSEDGWAMTVSLSKKSGDGWVQGTEYESYNYFFNLSKRLNSKHQLSFTAFGAPQEHYQRNSNDGLTIANWQSGKIQNYMGNDSRYKYNATYGFGKNGERKTSSYNQYHKPLMTLNHQWQISDDSNLSTALYLSLGRGNGYSGQGRDGFSNSSWYGGSYGTPNNLMVDTDGDGINETGTRNADGTYNYAAIQMMNENSITGSKMAMGKSVNDHLWYGIMSNYTKEINDELTFSGGLDARYYVGTHTNELIDLYNGAYYIDDSSRKNVKVENNIAAADPAWKMEKLQVGDVVYRDYDSRIGQVGLFGQLEYSTEELTSFISGSWSNHTYSRYDRFYYDAEHAQSDLFNTNGFTLKAGANYNVTEHSNVFANVGYISRAPFFSGGVFLNSTVSNLINPDAVNEKVFSAEIGYGFRNEWLNVNINAYYTKWMDKTMARTQEYTYYQVNGESFDADGNAYTNKSEGATAVDSRWSVNMTGVNAVHKGVEIDFTAKPNVWLEVNGMLSLGDWRWASNADGYFYDAGTSQPMKDMFGGVASATAAEDHLKTTINLKGIHVGGSPQTTASLGAVFKPSRTLRVGATYNIYARLYADYSLSANSISAGGVTNVVEPWMAPTGGQMDVFASQNFKFAGLDATLSGNVHNLFNQEYITFMKDGGDGKWNSAYGFYAMGRTYSVKLSVKF